MKVILDRGQMGYQDANKLRAIMQKIIDDYGLTLPKCRQPVLKISSHLTNAGAQFEYRYNSITYEIQAVVVKLSYKHYATFGYKQAYGALLHEMAHWLDWVFNGPTRGNGRADGHRESFKKICFDLGGAMNTAMAGEKYAAVASTDFLPKQYNWKYTCSCGVVFNAVRKIRTPDNQQCRKCKTRVSKWTVEYIGAARTTYI